MRSCSRKRVPFAAIPASIACRLRATGFQAAVAIPAPDSAIPARTVFALRLGAPRRAIATAVRVVLADSGQPLHAARCLVSSGRPAPGRGPRAGDQVQPGGGGFLVPSVPVPPPDALQIRWPTPVPAALIGGQS